FLRLAAFRLRHAVDRLAAAVSERAGPAQHSRAERRQAVQSRGAGPLTARPRPSSRRLPPLAPGRGTAADRSANTWRIPKKAAFESRFTVWIVRPRFLHRCGSDAIDIGRQIGFNSLYGSYVPLYRTHGAIEPVRPAASVSAMSACRRATAVAASMRRHCGRPQRW